MCSRLRRLTAVAAIGAPLWLSCTIGLHATASPQRNFSSPEEAAATLAQAARSGDRPALRAIFGPSSDKLLFSGDRYADQAQLQRFAIAYDEKHALVPRGSSRVELEVGANDWPLPIPIVQNDGSWQFDTSAGAEELVNRRIGRDELAAIRVMLTYVEAQKDYFARKAQQTGSGFYAERLVSTRGGQDGLYWPATLGTPESPFGPLIAQAQEEGYPGDTSDGEPVPYQGYYYRVLKAQGPDAPGGAKTYMQSGRMTGGYALLAWPARYGASGIMSFQVGQDGIVFQKDLGPNTASTAASIQRFDPDLSWARVTVTAQ